MTDNDAAERYEARNGKVGIKPRSTLRGVVHATYGIVDQPSKQATSLCGRQMTLEPLSALAEGDTPCRICFPERKPAPKKPRPTTPPAPWAYWAECWVCDGRGCHVCDNRGWYEEEDRI